jgi:hypothetical protein
MCNSGACGSNGSYNIELHKYAFDNGGLAGYGGDSIDGSTSGANFLTGVKTALDYSGYIPGASTITGLAGAGISLYERNYGEALWQAATAIPIAGPIAKVGKAVGIASRGVKAAGGGVASVGRLGKQARLRELANDLKVSSADRGWIQQEINSINRGQRRSIRVPPGKELAHQRGFEARLGYGYEYSDLQSVDLHRLQHSIEGYK